MPEKKCNKCDVVKPLDEFHKDNSKKDGRHGRCKECKNQYYQDNRERKLEYSKQYRQDNKEERLEYEKQYRQEHKETLKEYSRQYRQDNREERNEYQKEYITNRRANDPAFALRMNVRHLINKALKSNGGSKSGESVLQYLPYTIEQLKEHLESQFEPGMTWENRDEWHIDHIYPQSRLPYDSMSHPNFLKCWALENLQPLWAEENMSKGDKVL
tara:strand:- start:606 stop:1247 length:642 start_codon:yes stop_codon:yes gene_type:complete